MFRLNLDATKSLVEAGIQKHMRPFVLTRGFGFSEEAFDYLKELWDENKEE